MKINQVMYFKSCSIHLVRWDFIYIVCSHTMNETVQQNKFHYKHFLKSLLLFNFTFDMLKQTYKQIKSKNSLSLMEICFCLQMCTFSGKNWSSYFSSLSSHCLLLKFFISIWKVRYSGVRLYYIFLLQLIFLPTVRTKTERDFYIICLKEVQNLKIYQNLVISFFSDDYSDFWMHTS